MTKSVFHYKKSYKLQIKIIKTRYPRLWKHNNLQTPYRSKFKKHRYSETRTTAPSDIVRHLVREFTCQCVLHGNSNIHTRCHAPLVDVTRCLIDFESADRRNKDLLCKRFFFVIVLQVTPLIMKGWRTNKFSVWKWK